MLAPIPRRLTPPLAHAALILALASLAPVGCASLRPPSRDDAAHPRDTHASDDDRRHADLERELSLYSD